MRTMEQVHDNSRIRPRLEMLWQFWIIQPTVKNNAIIVDGTKNETVVKSGYCTVLYTTGCRKTAWNSLLYLCIRAKTRVFQVMWIFSCFFSLILTRPMLSRACECRSAQAYWRASYYYYYFVFLPTFTTVPDVNGCHFYDLIVTSVSEYRNDPFSLLWFWI